MRTRSALPWILLVLQAVGPDATASDPEIRGEELLAHVRRLASDEWKGRASGSPEERLVTEYIAEQFRALGLEPAGEEGTFFQAVPIVAGFRVDPACAFSVRGEDAVEVALALDGDFRPFSASASGTVDAGAVFAGYGVTAPDLGYDDYAGLETKGRVVFVFRHAPRGSAPWGGNVVRATHAPFVAKLARAADLGAAALVVVNDPHHHVERPDALQTASIGGGAPRIPFVHLTLRAARRVFPALFGATPEELEAAIHAGGVPTPA
ncbi:MAG: hypothetical protein ACREID_06330, partial [Planctomycetota bacterium]